jgi:hypothetical protein
MSWCKLLVRPIKPHACGLAFDRLARAFVGDPGEFNIDLVFGDRIRQADPIDVSVFGGGFHAFWGAS